MYKYRTGGAGLFCAADLFSEVTFTDRDLCCVVCSPVSPQHIHRRRGEKKHSTPFHGQHKDPGNIDHVTGNQRQVYQERHQRQPAVFPGLCSLQQSTYVAF